MNKILLASDFKLEASVSLSQTMTVVRQVRHENKKKMQEVKETQEIDAGTLEVEINLQSGDSEDELRRNY